MGSVMKENSGFPREWSDISTKKKLFWFQESPIKPVILVTATRPDARTSAVPVWLIPSSYRASPELVVRSAHSWFDCSTIQRRGSSVNCTLINDLWTKVFCEVLGLLHAPTPGCCCLPRAHTHPRVLLPEPPEDEERQGRAALPPASPCSIPQPVSRQGLLLLLLLLG